MPESLFNLEGKTAFLTGSTGYLGQYMARTLLRFGANAIILGRSNRIHKQRQELAAEFGDDAVTAYQVDMYDREQYGNLLHQVVVEGREIGILVNNAFDYSERTGFNTPQGYFGNSTYDQWMSCFISGLW